MDYTELCSFVKVVKEYHLKYSKTLSQLNEVYYSTNEKASELKSMLEQPASEDETEYREQSKKIGKILLETIENIANSEIYGSLKTKKNYTALDITEMRKRIRNNFIVKNINYTKREEIRTEAIEFIHDAVKEIEENRNNYQSICKHFEKVVNMFNDNGTLRKKVEQNDIKTIRLVLNQILSYEEIIKIFKLIIKENNRKIFEYSEVEPSFEKIDEIEENRKSITNKLLELKEKLDPGKVEKEFEELITKNHIKPQPRSYKATPEEIKIFTDSKDITMTERKNIPTTLTQNEMYVFTMILGENREYYFLPSDNEETLRIILFDLAQNVEGLSRRNLSKEKIAVLKKLNESYVEVKEKIRKEKLQEERIKEQKERIKKDIETVKEENKELLENIETILISNRQLVEELEETASSKIKSIESISVTEILNDKEQYKNVEKIIEPIDIRSYIIYAEIKEIETLYGLIEITENKAECEECCNDLKVKYEHYKIMKKQIEDSSEEMLDPTKGYKETLSDPDGFDNDPNLILFLTNENGIPYAKELLTKPQNNKLYTPKSLDYMDAALSKLRRSTSLQLNTDTSPVEDNEKSHGKTFMPRRIRQGDYRISYINVNKLLSVKIKTPILMVIAVGFAHNKKDIYKSTNKNSVEDLIMKKISLLDTNLKSLKENCPKEKDFEQTIENYFASLRINQFKNWADICSTIDEYKPEVGGYQR